MNLRVRRRRPGPLLQAFLGALLLLDCYQGFALMTDEAQQRLNVGLKLFPAILAADQGLGQRITPEGELLVLVVYDDEAEAAGEVAARLGRLERIQDRPLKVRTVRLDQLERHADPRPAGVFLVSPDVPELRVLVRRWHTLVFSPFIGDVERGAVAGIHVAERILPYVNLDQARNTGVRFKPFFLRVAKPYE